MYGQRIDLRVLDYQQSDRPLRDRVEGAEAGRTMAASKSQIVSRSGSIGALDVRLTQESGHPNGGKC